MDVVLQIFKRNIYSGTPFFESLAKKPLMTMDDLFRCANKYSILEDDVHTADPSHWPVGQERRGEEPQILKPMKATKPRVR